MEEQEKVKSSSQFQEPVAKLIVTETEVEKPTTSKSPDYLKLLVIITISIVVIFVVILIAKYLLKPSEDNVTRANINYENYEGYYIERVYCYDNKQIKNNKYIGFKELKIDDEALCEYNLELTEEITISKLSFELSTTETLEVFDIINTNKKKYNITKTNNLIEIELINPEYSFKPLELKLKVKLEDTENNIYFRNVHITTSDNKNYNLGDFKYSFEEKGILRKYKHNTNNSIVVLNASEFSYFDLDSYTLESEYTCISRDCRTIAQSGNYYLIYDNNEILSYYVGTDLKLDNLKKTVLKYNKDYTYELITNNIDSIAGFIINGFEYYHNSTGRKITLDPLGDNYFYSDPENNLLLVVKNNRIELYNFDTSPYIASLSKLSQIDNTEFRTFNNNNLKKQRIGDESNKRSIYINNSNYSNRNGKFNTILVFNENGYRLFENYDIKKIEMTYEDESGRIPKEINILLDDNILRYDKNINFIKKISLADNETLLEIYNGRYYVIKEYKDNEYHLVLCDFDNDKTQEIMTIQDNDEYIKGYAAYQTDDFVEIKFNINDKFYDYNTDQGLVELEQDDFTE